MKKKVLTTILGIVVMIILLLTYIKVRPIIFATYTECLEANWNIKLPKPDKVTLIGSTRGVFDGVGDESNEVIYHDEEDLENLNNSFQWFNYDEILLKISYDGVMLLEDRDKINRREISISDDNHEKVIEKLSKEAKYFYMDKNNKDDFIVFILEGNTLEIYESYR
ncbi:hypothetical protein [Clostridium sp. UBA5119]|uniref:hypothetical protein n=1 Tax=Clostridium sp. UBA5119 TaxID=1946366 RepID=UPI0032180FD6